MMPLDGWAIFFSLMLGLCLAGGFTTAWYEWHWLRSRGALSSEARRQMRLSLSPLLANLPVTFAMAGVWSALYGTASNYALTELPTTPWTVALAFLAVDFTYYWEHRCAHRVRVLWHLYHELHHSSSAYTVATAYRVSFMTQFFAPAFYLPWVLIGFDPVVVLGAQLIVFHSQAWIHTEMIGLLPRLDPLFNTPANHRIHHSAALEHRDRNMGAVLMIWDRLFGTYAGPAPNLHYGVPNTPSPETALDVHLAPWRRFSG